MSETTEKLTSFFHQYPATNYPKNHNVLAAGAEESFFYFVETGAVKMTTTSPTGKNVVLHIFFPNSFFSLLTLVTPANEYDFITLEPTTLRKIPRSELITFLKSHSDVLWDLQIRLLKGLNGLLKRVEQSISIPAYNQVASLLLYFSQHMTTSLPKITHQEIADWLGLSRENVSLQMEKLEKDELIVTQKNQIQITDRDKLQQIAQLLPVI